MRARAFGGCWVLALFAWIGHAFGAGVVQYASGQGWSLATGGMEYRLAVRGRAVYLEYFGPHGGPRWRMAGPDAQNQSTDIDGIVDGQPISPENLELLRHDVETIEPGVSQLRLGFRHRQLPLEIEATYRAWAETGVLTRQLKLTNTGSRALHVESVPSLSWQMPPGEYDLTYLWGSAGQERQMATEALGAGRRDFVSSRGRSSRLYSPWFVLRNATLGIRYAAQLAWSGNWGISFERLPEASNTTLSASDLHASLGMQFDYGGSLALRAGQCQQLAEIAFTSSMGDLDDTIRALHRYQRQFVFPRTSSNHPPLVQFNSWYAFADNIAAAELKRCADVAAQLGAEVFVLDAGWYSQRDWSRELGDYEVNRAAFPNGLEELSDYVRGRGMKFGLWVEIENAGIESRLFRQHPDWCLALNGAPLIRNDRCQLNFAKPEVLRWARNVVGRLVRAYELGWLKIDYNMDIGSQFDPTAVDQRPGDVLQRHVANYYAWLDGLRADFPDLVIENCSSGGMRFDIEMMRHSHTTWLSDAIDPVSSLQLGYGCTVEFAPGVCNHWMVGDQPHSGNDARSGPGWWDFMLRIPMNGQFGISSRVFDWSPETKARAAENIRSYKRIREVIADADVYHLTPPPDRIRPQGWMALQYVSPDHKRSAVMAYRLPAGNEQQVFRLRGLSDTATYLVVQDGESREKLTGGQLATTGLALRLASEWRATIVELNMDLGTADPGGR